MSPVTKGKSRYILALVVFLGWLEVCPAYAEQSGQDYGKVYAIQEKPFIMNHEISLSMAFLPLDAFYKYMVVSGHYTAHFDDFWAWEVVHLSWATLALDTGLKKELNDRWGITAMDTPRLEYFLDSNLMIKPLTGKMVLFDDWLINMESFVLVGLGAQRFESGAWYPAMDAGIGMRVFMSNTLSIRVEAREYVYMADSKVDSVLYFGASLCYNAFAGEQRLGERLEVGP